MTSVSGDSFTLGYIESVITLGTSTPGMEELDASGGGSRMCDPATIPSSEVTCGGGLASGDQVTYHAGGNQVIQGLIGGGTHCVIAVDPAHFEHAITLQSAQNLTMTLETSPSSQSGQTYSPGSIVTGSNGRHYVASATPTSPDPTTRGPGLWMLEVTGGAVTAGNVLVAASDSTSADVVAGSLGIGVAGAGIGASVGVFSISKDTEVWIGGGASGPTGLPLEYEHQESDPNGPHQIHQRGQLQQRGEVAGHLGGGSRAGEELGRRPAQQRGLSEGRGNCEGRANGRSTGSGGPVRPAAEAVALPRSPGR